MRLSLPYLFIAIFLAFAFATVMTSEALAKGECPADQISTALQVPESVFN